MVVLPDGSSELFLRSGAFEAVPSKLFLRSRANAAQDARARVSPGKSGQRGCSSVVERQPSKLKVWVRFPSPAPDARSARSQRRDPKHGGACTAASFGALWSRITEGCCSSVVEHFLGKEEVTGSSPVSSSTAHGSGATRDPRAAFGPGAFGRQLTIPIHEFQ